MFSFLSRFSRVGQRYNQLTKSSSLLTQTMSTTSSPSLPFSAMPGPSGTFSNLFQYTRGGGISHMCEIQKKRFERYGPIFAEKLFNRVIVNISDAEALAKVLRAEPSFPKRPGFEAFLKCLEEHDHVSGMASNDRDLWYKERSILSPKMMRPMEVNAFLSKFNEVSKDVLDRVHLGQKNGVVENLENELFYWAAESVCMFLFDERLGFYNHPPDPDAVTFVEAALELNEGLGKLLFGLPLYKYFNTPSYNRLRASVNTIYTLGQDMVNETEATKGERKRGETSSPTSLFTHLSDSGQFNSKSIVNILIGMMNAGVDTTTIVALWTIYLLCKYPDTQEKLHQELRSVLGPHGEVSARNINQLSYLKACVKESMRLRPPTIVTPRKFDHDFDVMGYTIPGGTDIMLYTLLLSTSEKHYGQDAKRFVPERWSRDQLEERGTLKDVYNAFTTIPFGYGVRMCIGRRIAEAELYSLLSLLVLKYRMEYVGKTEPKQYVSALVKPDIPLLVKFTPR